MKSIRLPLWWKLTGSMAGLVFVVMSVVLVLVSALVEQRIRADITRNFDETGRTFERIQEIRFRLLYQTAILLTDLPTVKGAMSTGDRETVTQLIRNDLQPLLDFDPVLSDAVLQSGDFSHPDSLGLLLILDRNGYPLGQLTASPLADHSLADRAGITQALQGDYPQQFYIWEQDGRYFNVITVPVWLGFDLLGTLSFGYPIRQAETEQLARDTGLEVLYFVNNRILTHTIPFEPGSREIWSRDLFSATFEVVSTGQATRTQLQHRDGEWIVYLASMLPAKNTSAGISGYYVVARSLDQALEPLIRLQSIIFIVGLLSVLLASLISAALASRINRPIHLLTLGIQRIESGEYNEAVPVVTTDELSALTQTFNHLVLSLRERLEMLKFVSRATLEAIQKNMRQVEPGGTRKTVTVFFSDIRGFTRWSEKRDPEAVIEMLNTCLRLQADLVRECGGDIDKFVGDELVAVFEGDTKEARAVDAAIRIQRVISERMGASEDIHIGVGINTGDVVMGAVGSNDRMDYTVIGNHVNLGARLCSAASPGQILISGSVAERLERRIPVIPLEPILAKGIEKPVPVFEVNWKQLAIIVLLGLGLGAAGTTPGQAQMVMGGLADVELRHASPGSGPKANQTPREGTHIFTPSLRLFFEHTSTSGLTMTGVLQADYYATQTLQPVFVSLLSARWRPWSDRNFDILAGRLVTPVGAHSERFLSSETPFRHSPLSHERFNPVDAITGYSFGKIGNAYPGATLVYNRMYTNGIGITGQIGDVNALTYTVLATAAAPSGAADISDYGISGAMGRLTWDPAIFLRLGISGGWGPYMKPSAENDMLSRRQRSNYRQVLAGADAEISYMYAILRLEYIWTRYQAPQLQRADPIWSGTRSTNGNWVYVENDVEAVFHYLASEVILRQPAFPGLKVVARTELLVENSVRGLELPQNANVNFMPSVLSRHTTDNRYFSFEGGLTYDLSRDVTVKLTRHAVLNDRDTAVLHTTGLALAVVF